MYPRTLPLLDLGLAGVVGRVQRRVADLGIPREAVVVERQEPVRLVPG